MSKLVATALEDMGLSSKITNRSTNMFALGLLYWIYGRSMDSSIKFLQKKFASKPEIVEANIKALNTGYYYGETIEAIKETQQVNWGTIISHRSGETEDTVISDIAVGMNSGQIKCGAPARGERTAKYNRLIRIEEELGDKSRFLGKNIFYNFNN